MRLTNICFAAVLLGATGAANAQTSAPAVAAAPSGKVVKDPNRMICRTLDTTGSRLKPVRDCRTAKAWADAQELDRRDIDRIQTNRYKNE